MTETLNWYHYSSNNSGGSWWLSDDDWRNLEAAGWQVEWKKDSQNPIDRMLLQGDRWLGALATSARKQFPSEAAAIEEFERITGASFNAEGCGCCGRPHYISQEPRP